MPLAVGGDIQLCLSLSAPDLAGSPLLTGFLLLVLGLQERFSRSRYGGLALCDPGGDLTGAGLEGIEPRRCSCFALRQSLDESSGFSRLSRGPLVLSGKRCRSISGVGARSRCLR